MLHRISLQGDFMTALRPLAVAAIALAMAAPALANGVVNSTAYSDPAQRIYVDRGQYFVVVLGSHQSNGIAWHASIRQGGITQLGRAYHGNDVPRAGAPEEEIFLFRADRPGTAIIRFQATSGGSSTPADTKYFDATVR